MIDERRDKPNPLVSPYGEPKPTEPHAGHEHTRFEGVDASVKLILTSLGIIALTLVIAFAITIPIQKSLEKTTPLGEPRSPLAPWRVVPPAPQIQVHPWETLPDVRDHEDAVLNGKARDSEGQLRIPINQAMDMVVSQLNIRPNAPVGITVPGGEGRAFAGSINNMPPAYQRPKIQGEIRKRAQK